MKAKRYNKGGKAALYDMLKKYAKGGKMYEEGGPVEGDPKKEAMETIHSIIAADNASQESGTNASLGSEKSTDVFLPGVAAAIRDIEAYEGARPEEAPRDETRPEEAPIPMRSIGPKSVRQDLARMLMGGRKEMPEQPSRRDYGFQAIMDQDNFRHPYGKSITTRSTGEETDTSGAMGVKMGGKYYYMPNARGFTGPKGKNVRDFREIKQELGEDAYMEALSILQSRGADISRLVD